jgi:hypothetical protein
MTTKVIFTLSTEDSTKLGLERVGELTDAYTWVMDDGTWDRSPYNSDQEQLLIARAIVHFGVEGVEVENYHVVADGDDLLITPRS